MTDNQKAALAAAIILGGFSLIAYLMPRIMNAVGAYSPLAALAVAVCFVGAFFAIFWLRARAKRQ